MAYTETWNAAFEASPANSDAASQGAGKIRNLKTDIRERVAKDHYMDVAGTDADHGEHVKCTLRATSDPTAVAAKGFLYTKDAGAGAIELYYRDAAGNITKITAAGILNSIRDIPSGETILFEKNTAVSGYTLLTDKNDMQVYITSGSGAGGETGATDKSGGTWTQPGHAHVYVSTTGDVQNATGTRSSSATYDYIYHHNHAVSGTTSDAVPVNTWRPPGRNFTRQTRN